MRGRLFPRQEKYPQETSQLEAILAAEETQELLEKGESDNLIECLIVLTDYQVYPFESKLDEPNDDLLIGEKVRVYALEWLTKEYGFDHPQLLTILEEKIFHCHFTFQESLKTKGQSDHFRSSPIQSACLEILLDWAHQGSRQAKKVIRRILRHHPYLDFRQFTLEKINLKKQLAPFVP